MGAMCILRTHQDVGYHDARRERERERERETWHWWARLKWLAATPFSIQCTCVGLRKFGGYQRLCCLYAHIRMHASIHWYWYWYMHTFMISVLVCMRDMVVFRHSV